MLSKKKKLCFHREGWFERSCLKSIKLKAQVAYIFMLWQLTVNEFLSAINEIYVFTRVKRLFNKIKFHKTVKINLLNVAA